MRVYRPRLIQEMQSAARELRENGSATDEILFYLVKKYRPSFIELRSTLHRILEFMGERESERGLLADKATRIDINRFNKEHRLDQLIGTEKQRWEVFKGKRTVTRAAFILGIAIGELAEESAARHRRQRAGLNAKIHKLKSKTEDSTHYKREADKLERLIERRRRSGR